MAHPGGGRPLKYKTAALLQAAINSYFSDCDNQIIIKQVVQKGEIVLVPTPTPYTMAGLARALDVDRKSLVNYDHRDGFFPLIAQARGRIEESNVSLGLVGCHDSRIAALNLASNYGYSDKREVEINIPQLAELDDAALDARLTRLLESREARQLAQGHGMDMIDVTPEADKVVVQRDSGKSGV